MTLSLQNQKTSPFRCIHCPAVAAWLVALLGAGCGSPGAVGPRGSDGQPGMTGVPGRDAVVKMYELSVPVADFIKSTTSYNYYAKVTKIPKLDKTQAVLGFVYTGNPQTYWAMPFNWYYNASDVTLYDHFGVDVDQAGQLYLDITNSKGVVPISGGGVSYRLYVMAATTVTTLSQQIDPNDPGALEEALQNLVTE